MAMEVIIRGKRIEMEKASCLSGVEASILETLSAGVPDTRQVVASLDKLGRFLMEDENFLVSELMELGLSGGADASAKRLALLKKLGFPEHMSANAMLQALNLLYSLDELNELVKELW